MPETISFARGIPAPEMLPADELADCARVALADRAALSYGPSRGFLPLREWVADRHGVDPERVLLTNGSLQGFVLLAQQLLRSSGGRVLVEAPTYDRPLRVLADLGAEIVPVRVDADGLVFDALAAALRSGPRPAFLYTIPTFQNPTGRTLSLARRRQLVELAREDDLLVLEDDPYGLVRFAGEPLPTLHELDGGDRVVYSSSFSKTVAPGLRVGYLVLPAALAPALEAAAGSTYIAPAGAGQATLWEFIRRGRLDDNLERVRALLRDRRDTMVATLRERVGDAAAFTRPDGGYFVWLELADGIDEAAVVARAGVSAGEIETGVERLAAALPALAAA